MTDGFFSTKIINKGKLPDCSRCGLHRSCLSPWMKVWGDYTNGILLVGEAPGADEDKQNRPFVGRSGQLLQHSLRKVGIEFENCAVTNAVVCRPPNNIINDRYLDYCRPLLNKVIRKLKPKLIITLGFSAFRQTMNEFALYYGGGIGKWRGWNIPDHENECWVCPTYHPSYVRREENNKAVEKIFVNDLRNAKRIKNN